MKKIVFFLILCNLVTLSYAVRMGENAVNVAGDTMTGDLTINANLTQGAGAYTSSLSTLTVNGNITVSGTVDGVDISTVNFVTVTTFTYVTNLSTLTYLNTLGISTTDISSKIDVMGGSVTVRGNNAGLTIGTFTVTLAGKVGIGTLSPSANLEILGTNGKVSFEKEEGEVYGQRSPGDVSFGPAFYLRKTRGTVASPTVVVDNDKLGWIQFQGYDGSAFRSGAVIVGSVNGDPGASDMPGSLDFQTTPDNSATALSRLIILANGNVGVSISTPTTILAVAQGSNTDPIADSWTTYTSDLSKKNIINTFTDVELSTMIAYKLKNTKIYKYTHKSLPYGVDIYDTKGQKVSTIIEYRKHDNREHLGITVDNCPQEILVKDSNGIPIAIDLFDYCNFLMSAVKSLQTEVDLLKSR